MAVIYDPVTGLPKQQGAQTNTGYGAPQAFASTSTAGSTGATGFNTTGATGATGSGSNLPSWQDFLANDPFWKQLNADLSAQGIADEASAKASAQRAIIGFGEAPSDLTGQAGGWIDDTTRQLAQQNTAAGLSQKARVDKQNTDAIRQIRNMLAARGGLQSGEFGYQLKENQGQYERAQYDQRQALTDTLSGISAGLAAAQRQAAASRAQGLSTVITNYYGQQPPADGGGTTGEQTHPGYTGPKEYIGNDPQWDLDKVREALALQESARRGRTGRPF